ncbi:hypothetical protein BGY98DRAFT_936125 [Russula aff. rugulosa BPL654]|nr:hypothetical protein BGY98DRAFT_936125 [Russula aff. rugulosa BPL654]
MVHAAWSPSSSSTPHFGRAVIVDGEAAHLDKEAPITRSSIREIAQVFFPSFPLPTPCGLSGSRITEMTCASDKPRLLTSLISRRMEAYIGMRIITVLVGRLRNPNPVYATRIQYAIVSFFPFQFFRRSHSYYSLAETALRVSISSMMYEVLDVETFSVRKDAQDLQNIGYYYSNRFPPTEYSLRPPQGILLRVPSPGKTNNPSHSGKGHRAPVFPDVPSFATFAVGDIAPRKPSLLLGSFVNITMCYVRLGPIALAIQSIAIWFGPFLSSTKEEFAGAGRPSCRFYLKLIVLFTFYQSFVFNALKGRVIHGTQFWTATNVADGLNVLTICIEAWVSFHSQLVLPG